MNITVLNNENSHPCCNIRFDQPIREPVYSALIRFIGVIQDIEWIVDGRQVHIMSKLSKKHAFKVGMKLIRFIDSRTVGGVL